MGPKKLSDYAYDAYAYYAYNEPILMANSWQMELSDNSWQMELSDNSWQIELSYKIFLLYLTEIGFELIHKLKGVLP